MPDTGWLSPASTEEYGGGGYDPFSTIVLSPVANTYDGDDLSFAYGDMQKGGTGLVRDIFFHDFGAGIPEGSIIDGIETRITYGYFSSYVPFLQFLDGYSTPVTKNQLIGGNEQFFEVRNGQSSPYDPHDTTNRTAPDANRYTNVWGAPNALWGFSSLTAAAVNDPEFGLMLSGNADGYQGMSLHEVKVRFHYTEVANDPMSVRDGGTWKAASPYVKDGGIWKPATPSIRAQGLWQGGGPPAPDGTFFEPFDWSSGFDPLGQWLVEGSAPIVHPDYASSQETRLYFDSTNKTEGMGALGCRGSGGGGGTSVTFYRLLDLDAAAGLTLTVDTLRSNSSEELYITLADPATATYPYENYGYSRLLDTGSDPVGTWQNHSVPIPAVVNSSVVWMIVTFFTNTLTYGDVYHSLIDNMRIE
jgi:hypothetical protein